MIGELLAILPPYQGKKTLISRQQSTDDIIQEILRGHKKFSPDYDKIAGKFWQGSADKTARYIFDFCKKYLPYKIEPDIHQSIKSPAAILSQANMQTGWNDCKHYATFINGIFDALRRQGKKVPEIIYRFANYRDYKDIPHHVFAVLKFPAGREVWIDPVLKNFNQRKPYTNSIDKKIMLYQISGVGTACRCQQSKIIRRPIRARRFAAPGMQAQILGADAFGQLDLPGIGAKKPKQSKAQKNATKQSKKVAKQKQKQVKKQMKQAKKAAQKKAGHCKGSLLKKIALAPARNAFLALVKLNFKSIGVKLVNTYKDQNKRRAMFKKWCSLGGSSTALEGAILSVAKKKKIAIVGIAPAALLAAAAAIIKALKEFLPSGTLQDVAEAVQQIPEAEAVQQVRALNEEGETAPARKRMNIVKSQDQETGEQYTTATDADASPEEVEQAKSASLEAGRSLSGNNLLLFGGLAAAAIIISRKN